jgi:molecular chaperone GrpE
MKKRNPQEIYRCLYLFVVKSLEVDLFILSTLFKTLGSKTTKKKDHDSESEKEIVKKKLSKRHLLEEIKKIKESLKMEEEKAERYLNQLKYVQADFENLKKRFQKLMDEAVDKTRARLLINFLIILDELELAIVLAKRTDANIIEGVEMIKDKFKKIIESEEVSPIEAMGKPFDPNFHEAILEVETDNQPDGYVTEEIRKGYIYKNRTLRTSIVKVARNKNKKDNEENLDE